MAMYREYAPKLTVVIATLGGQALSRTLESIERSTVVPHEVLICVPDAERENVRRLECGNVKVLITKSRGQVAQRAEGFLAAGGDLVLQMDDDVVFDPNAIHTTVQYLLKLGPKHVVGPVFCDDVNHQPIGRFTLGVSGIWKNLYFTLIGGLPWGKRRMGAYSPRTCAISVDPAAVEKSLYPVQWLAGGFVLGYREDLVFDNFFPLRGKAYCEDLLHAQYRHQKGIQHMVATQVMVSTKPQDDQVTHEELEREFRARRVIAQHLGATSYGFMVFRGFEFLRRVLKAKL